MADYQLTDSDIVVRTKDKVFIPNDPRNPDRAEYEAWHAAGGVPDPYVAPPPSPLVRDANERINAGVLAATGTVVAARDAVHEIQTGGAVAPRFDALLIQMKVTMDAFVAMLQAQAALNPQRPEKPQRKPN